MICPTQAGAKRSAAPDISNPHRPSDPGQLTKSKRFIACMSQTMDATVKQVNAPLVTARYVGPRATVLATK